MKKYILTVLTLALVLVFTLIGGTGAVSATSGNLITNGDFGTGDFTSWTVFQTENGVTNQSVTTSYIATFETCNSIPTDTWEGGGISQSFSAPAGTWLLSLSVMAIPIDYQTYPRIDNHGPKVEVLIDDTVVDYHTFDSVWSPLYTYPASFAGRAFSITGNFPSAGSHEIKIRITTAPMLEPGEPLIRTRVDNIKFRMVSLLDGEPVWRCGEHFYMVVPGAITWEDANSAADRGATIDGTYYRGHLATITSSEENAFVYDLLTEKIGSGGRGWIGGYQLSDQTSTSAGWQWVTGEDMTGYTNWDPGSGDSPIPSPNDAGGDDSGDPPTTEMPNPDYYGLEDNSENYMEMRGKGYWDDLGGTVTNSSYVIEFEPTYQLTIVTDPFGIDGTTGFGQYESGETVDIFAPENFDIISRQSRYHFTGWTGAGVTFADASSPSSTMSMPASDTTVTANYQAQYYLTVDSGGYGTAGGSDWYTTGTNAQATITPLTVDGTTGTQYVFTGWSGDASGSGSPSNNILMDGPKTATATWGTQYYLTINTNPAGIDSPTGQNWYNEGTTAHVSTAEYADIVTGRSRYHFISWSGAVGTFSDATVVMDSAKTVTANYETQYNVQFAVGDYCEDPTIIEDGVGTILIINDTLQLDRNSLPFSDWFMAGSTCTYEFTDVVEGSSGEKYRFTLSIPHGIPSTEWDRFARSGSFLVNNSVIVPGIYTRYLVTVTPDTSQYSDNVTFAAEISPCFSDPFVYPTNVHFYIGNQEVGSAPITGTGIRFATMNTALLETVAGQLVAGEKVVTAKWDNQDAAYNPTTSLFITKENAAVTYTGDEGFMFTAGPTIDTATVRLSAHLEQEDDDYPGDITRATVDFLIYQGSSVEGTPTVVANIPVDASGNALTTKQLTTDQFCIIAKISPSNGYWTSPQTSDPALITIDTGSGSQMVTGGGWITDAQSLNGKANFGFTVNYQKKGTPKGNSIFLFRGSDGYNYLVKSNSWVGGGLTFYDTNSASFSGKCVIQKIDKSTGLVVDSIGNCTFTADILDGDLNKTKGADKYSITILGPDGIVWHQIGTINSPIDIGGGNVVVRSK